MVRATQDLTEIACQVLRGERDYVASHAGRSQYSAGGTSACGLAALNCARIVLQREKKEAVKAQELIIKMMQREMCEDVLDICLQWSSSAHLDVDEISSAPIFNKTLRQVWSEYERPGFEQFQALLDRLKESTRSSAALVITRPPEIICVLKIVTPDESKALFITFDSHPRHTHPQGAAFIFHASLDAAAKYLSELLQYDPHLLSDPALQWQAQLLAHYSAHMFVAKDFMTGPTARQEMFFTDVERILVDASLDVLRLKAEIAELRERTRSLEADARDLVAENTQHELRVEDLEDENRELKRKLAASAAQNRTIAATSPSSVSTSYSTYYSSRTTPTAGPSSAATDRAWPWSSPTTSGRTDRSTQPSSHVAASSSPKGKLVCRVEDELDEDNELFATRIQLEWREEAARTDDNVALALQEQMRYEEEDRQLRMQLQELQQNDQKTFDCGVCMDTLPEDVVASVELCGHNFCRACMLQHLQSKLTEHRFPILCPTCAADRGTSNPGTISGYMAQQIGLSEREYAIFTELEMASFSVLLHCRQCQKAVFVDKAEYDAQEIIACPLPGCTHAWCKACSRSIDFNGPRHSCDGTSELNHLMAQQGWKNCPGCQTPTSKTEGCNHMTCISPGCNTHFCYLCGANIVRSVLRGEIKTALERHYSRCNLIELPAALRNGRG